MVLLRLGAALLAVAAGAGAIAIAVHLLSNEPVAGSSGGAGVAAPAPSPSIEGGRIATPNEPTFPSPPPGAVVLGREAGDRALGLAILPGGRTSLVRVSLLGGSGLAASGLVVTVRFGGQPAVRLDPCGPGCYQANILSTVVTRRVAVSIGEASYPFSLPTRGALADGTKIVENAGRVWRGLKTLIWRERLAANPTDALYTLYKAVAPDDLSYTVAGHSAAVIIGNARYDRATPTGPWVKSTQDPPIVQPLPFWAGISDAHILGSGRVHEDAVWIVSFFDPETPGWFEAKIAKATGRTLELDMTAVAHFMHHEYGPFDAPFRLHAPAT